MKFTLAISTPTHTRYDIYDGETWIGEIDLYPKEEPVITLFYPLSVKLSFINKLTNFIASHGHIDLH